MTLAGSDKSYRPAERSISATRLVPWAEAGAGHPSSSPRQPYPQPTSPLLEGAFATFQDVANCRSDLRILQPSAEPVNDFETLAIAIY